MKLQVHVTVDPAQMQMAEITEFKKTFVKEMGLAVRKHAREETMDIHDINRLSRERAPLYEQWRFNQKTPLRAVVSIKDPRIKWLTHGNSANSYLVHKYGGVIMRKDGKPIRFRSRKTGEIVYAKWVRVIDPENIHRTVPYPYTFRTRIVQAAMDRGADHALQVMKGTAAWRGVLQVRST